MFVLGNLSTVWTGSDAPAAASANDCSGWTAATGNTIFGTADYSGALGFNKGAGDCSWSLHLYCLEE
jgi:hypothetical protein